MAAKAKVLVALHSFEADVGGKLVLVHGGDKLRSTDPIAKSHGQMFEPADKLDHEHKPARTARGRARAK